jgi:autotransporter-associated beta strand protein
MNPHLKFMVRTLCLWLSPFALGLQSLQAVDYSWNSAAAADWTNASAWNPNTGTPSNSLDNFVTPTAFGQINMNTSPTVGNFNWSGGTAQTLTVTGSSRTLTIDGGLSKSGVAALTLRSSSATIHLTISVAGSLSNSAGTLHLGTTALNGFSAGSAALSGASTTNFVVGNGTGATFASISGALNMTVPGSGNTTLNLFNSSTGGTSGGLTVGSLTGGSSTAGNATIIRSNGNSTGGIANTAATLRINGASGSSSFAGVIANGSGGTTNSLTSNVSVDKQGNGTQIFTGANTYSGATTISAGTLLVNGTHTTAGAYTVSGGTLGGAGTITTAGNAGISLSSGARLSIGDSSIVDTTATMTAVLVAGIFDLSGAVGGANTNALVFELGATGPGNSDIFSLTTGALNIGSGELEFSDFNFTALAGFGTGTYTLFDTNSVITGSLGSSLSGTLGGYAGTLSFANSNNDLVLTVAAVPEPSSGMLIWGGLGMLVLFRRKR